MDVTRIEKLCVEKGLRMTDQRRVIARVLSEAVDHPDAEDLYRRGICLPSSSSLSEEEQLHIVNVIRKAAGVLPIAELKKCEISDSALLAPAI